MTMRWIVDGKESEREVVRAVIMGFRVGVGILVVVVVDEVGSSVGWYMIGRLEGGRVRRFVRSKACGKGGIGSEGGEVVGDG